MISKNKLSIIKKEENKHCNLLLIFRNKRMMNYSKIKRKEILFLLFKITYV